MTMALGNIREAAERLGDAEMADILFFNGEIVRPIEHKFIDIIINRNRRTHVILLIVTPGGDADAAYRIGRSLQKHYERITVFISGWCKSAGTLVALSGHRLVFSEFGEIGPLDLQAGKQTDLYEHGSGLAIEAALKQLSVSSWTMFEDVMLAIERSSGGRLAAKTAAALSSDLVGRLFGKLYSQVDPMKIGENSRLMTIARHYGQRLADGSGNLKAASSLDHLVSSYASHGFVIDFDEAAELFNNVDKADGMFDALRKSLGDVGVTPISATDDGEVMLTYLNKEIENSQSNSESEGEPAPHQTVGGQDEFAVERM